MTTSSPLVWIAFNAVVISLIAFDALVLSPSRKETTVRKALALTAFWVLLALLFNIGIYCWAGSQKALEFFTGYLVEQSLSIDNLFVFLLIFSYFKVSPQDQRKVLFWGIIGAQVMRAIFIYAGIVLLQHFHWLMYIFGAFLVFSGIKLWVGKDKEGVDPEKNVVLVACRRFFPAMHALMVVLIIIETTDLLFAVDSIPAVLAITKDPFIAYSSNIFAILGLRAMYFALAGVMKYFHHLHYGLAAVLVFIGFKMLIEHFWTMPIVLALGFIATAVTVSIITSLLFPIESKKAHA